MAEKTNYPKCRAELLADTTQGQYLQYQMKLGLPTCAEVNKPDNTKPTSDIPAKPTLPVALFHLSRLYLPGSSHNLKSSHFWIRAAWAQCTKPDNSSSTVSRNSHRIRAGPRWPVRRFELSDLPN